VHNLNVPVEDELRSIKVFIRKAAEQRLTLYQAATTPVVIRIPSAAATGQLCLQNAASQRAGGLIHEWLTDYTVVCCQCCHAALRLTISSVL
jgi:hypothetical protein